MSTTKRIHLVVPIDVSIQMEKACDLRGISKSQLMKEAINEKVGRIEESNVKKDILDIKDDISQIKDLLIALQEKIG